jgi:hypothetical protein
LIKKFTYQQENHIDQEDQEVAEVDVEVRDQGAPQPEQMDPSLDPDQPFDLAGKFFS